MNALKQKWCICMLQNLTVQTCSARWTGCMQKPETCIRRFCLHILPKSFVRICHYGLLSSSKRNLLHQLQQAFGIFVPPVKEKKNRKQICREHLNFNPDTCPRCSKGIMITIETFLPGRSPPGTLMVKWKSINKNVAL